VDRQFPPWRQPEDSAEAIAQAPSNAFRPTCRAAPATSASVAVLPRHPPSRAACERGASPAQPLPAGCNRGGDRRCVTLAGRACPEGLPRQARVDMTRRNRGIQSTDRNQSRGVFPGICLALSPRAGSWPRRPLRVARRTRPAGPQRAAAARVTACTIPPRSGPQPRGGVLARCPCHFRRPRWP